MEGGRLCGKRKGMAKFGSFIGVMVAGLAGRWGTGANAQFTDGGAVTMDCGVCFCEGSSADGTIEVFDNPSSGERVRQLLCVVRSSRQSAEMNFTVDFCDFVWAPQHVVSLVYSSPLTPPPSEKAFRQWNKLCFLATRGDVGHHARLYVRIVSRAGWSPSFQPLPVAIFAL